MSYIWTTINCLEELCTVNFKKAVERLAVPNCYKDCIKRHIQSSGLDLMSWENTARDKRAWHSTAKEAE